MLSADQRAKIIGDIEEIANDLSLTVLDERQRIENLDDFPLIQTTFLAEGRRQEHWQDLLYDWQDADTHEWTSYYGNISQATVSVSIRSLDVDELKTKAAAFALALWKQAHLHWRMETVEIEFRGTDPPRFLPAYLDAVEQRHDIYSCVIDFFVDYEFSWSQIDPPITNIQLNTTVGLIDDEDMSDPILLYTCAPGCYLMSGSVTGTTSAYRMTGTIT